MKQVKFIDIKAKSVGWSLWRGEMYAFPEIKEKVAKMMEEGWRYMGFVPLETSRTSNIEKISLLFEKESENKEK